MVRMKKNWKRWLCGAGAFLLAVGWGGSLSYATEESTLETQVTVMDDAGLLMEEEVDWLKSVAAELAEKSDWNIVVATCDDAEGQSAQTVCEDYFNEYTTGEDGISCLLDMDNREIYIATAGEAQLYLNDSRIDTVLDEAYVAVSDGDYPECLYLMVLRSSEAYDLGIPENAEIYDENTGKTLIYDSKTGEFVTKARLSVSDILIAIGAAILAGGAVFAFIVGKYKLKWGTYHYDFHDSGSLTLEKEEDHFVNQTVTRRHIPKNDGDDSTGGGGRSRIHRGSGDRSFGGRGRKF